MGQSRKVMVFLILLSFIFNLIVSLNFLYFKNPASTGSINDSNITSHYTDESYIIWDNSPLTILGQESKTNIDAIRFGDVIGDNKSEVIVTLNSTIDYLMVFNSSNGKQLWNISSKGLVSAFDQKYAIGKREGFLFITDIRGDSGNEIVIPHTSYNNSIYGGIKANVTAINPLTHSIVWNADIWEYGKFWYSLLSTWSGPNEIRATAIGDINNDGKSEIVVGTRPGVSYGNGQIFMLNGTDGNLLWKQNGTKYKCDFLAMADINHDHQAEVIAISDDTIVALNGTNGHQIWKYILIQKVNSLAVSDINGDSCADIVVGSSKVVAGSVAVAAINGSNGKSLWNFSTPSSLNPIYDIKIANLYNDSTPEIIARCGGGSNYKIYVLNHTGGEIWSKVALVNTIAIADFDGDKILDVVYGQTNGKYVYALDGSNGALIFKKQVTSNNQYFQIASTDFAPDPYGKLLVSDFTSDLMMMQKNIYPDLSITSADIAFSPQCPYQGQNVTINCSISNKGNVNITNCKVSFYYDTQNPINLIKNKSINVNIYTPVQVSVIWNTSGHLGNHNIIVITDPDNLIFESNKTNNVAIKTLFIMDETLGPDIHLISPLNTTYNTPNIPVNITNSTEVHRAWFRFSNNGGNGWTANFSLIYNGFSFTNSTIWVNNHYLLQIFADNSYGKISMLQVKFTMEILQQFYTTDFLITPPSIDGILNSNEWGKITFNRTITIGDAHFYLKTNSSYLFLACDFVGDSIQNMYDGFSVFIDDQDHILSAGHEHEFVIYGDGYTYYYYWQGVIWTMGTKPAGFLGGVSYSTGHAVYEMQIPLNSIFSSVGNVIAISISASDYDKGGLADWPIGYDYYNPATWGDLELSGYFSISKPLNITYNTPMVPINIENASYVQNAWYRNTTGMGWSGNATLIWMGNHFTNSSSILWKDGIHHLQVFCNGSFGKIYQMDRWFTIDTAFPPLINITTPNNITYTNENVPVIVTNASKVLTCWYRHKLNGDGRWSGNSTLIYTGPYFSNSTTLIWQTGLNYLQVFANNSFGKISMREIWFSISLPLYNFINITAISPNPSNGFTLLIVTNSSILTMKGVLANVSGPANYFKYILITFQGGNQWTGNFTVFQTGTYTIKVNGTNLGGITSYDMEFLEGDITPPVLIITRTQSNGKVIIIVNSNERLALLQMNISGPNGFFLYPNLVNQISTQWIGNFSPITYGFYTIRVNGTDIAGNNGCQSNIFEYKAPSSSNIWIFILIALIIAAGSITIGIFLKKRKGYSKNTKRQKGERQNEKGLKPPLPRSHNI